MTTKQKFVLIVLLLFVTPFLWASEAGHGPALDGDYWISQLVKLVNTGIVAALLFFFLRKPVMNFFKQRASQIDDNLQAAQLAREEAEKRLKEVEEEVAHLEKKVTEIKDQAVREGETEKERIIGKAREEASRMLITAEREIENRIKSGRLELKAYATELAISKARMIIEQQINQAKDEQLIKDALVGIGGEK